MSNENTPMNNIVTVEIDRLTMYTKAPGTENERASLSWQMVNMGTGYGYNPRITVWTRVPNDSKRPIDAALNAHSAEMLLSLIEQVCDAEPGFQAPAITCEVPMKDETTGERMKGYRVVSKVVVGKDKTGVVRIAVISGDPERPQISFKFETGMMHHLVHKDGSPYDEASCSVLAARAAVRVLRNVYAKYCPLITEQDKQTQKSFREQRGGMQPQRPRQQQQQQTQVKSEGFEDITF